MNRMMQVLLVAGVLAACATTLGRYPPESLAPAEVSITADELLAHVRRLASDEFEGRSPGTRGEELTIAYLAEQFRALKLEPGHSDGSYFQKVPLVGLTAQRTASLTAGGKRMRMNFPGDYVAMTNRQQAQVRVPDSELVFVGYGVVAPEYDWDDYKDVDVRGKTLVMLVNDPAIPDPEDPSRLDAAMFGGKAMTYYGRWTYKYEIATAKGAAAALLVHETGPAGYPYEVVMNSWGRENFAIEAADGNAGRVAIEGWLSEERARKLFELSGHSFESMKQAALRKDFRPIALPARASFTVRNKLRRVQSHNVVAQLRGSDPELNDEYVVYSAHWDHFGRDPKLAGDTVFNGALDNATGTAALLEIAQAFAKLPAPPRRSVLFLAVTAEERGLLGSKWYAEHPLYPLTKTVANINIDGLNVWGRTSDVVVVGKGQSSLEDVLATEVAAQKRTLLAEPTPERGSYYRSDHFEFAKVGVPALYAKAGDTYVGRPAGWGRQKVDEYVAHHYHKVSDDIKDDWDLGGAVEDLRLLLRVGIRVAETDAYPEWKAGSEFRARREQMLQDPSR